MTFLESVERSPDRRRSRRQDPYPHRHQEIELPPIEPMVIEYRLHQLSCDVCGEMTQAPLPPGVSASGYGERVSAIVALLSGPYRQSYRQVCRFKDTVFGGKHSGGLSCKRKLNGLG
ncbi:MAG: hypothetical protein AAGF93_11910 [Cyanobacteria bacterium P01_H01_bin.105]